MKKFPKGLYEVADHFPALSNESFWIVNGLMVTQLENGAGANSVLLLQAVWMKIF